jgi:hypothetical protein
MHTVSFNDWSQNCHERARQPAGRSTVRGNHRPNAADWSCGYRFFSAAQTQIRGLFFPLAARRFNLALPLCAGMANRTTSRARKGNRMPAFSGHIPDLHYVAWLNAGLLSRKGELEWTRWQQEKPGPGNRA